MVKLAQIFWVDLLVCAGAAVLLVLAGAHHVYSYYTFLRIAVFAVAAYMSWRAYTSNRTLLLILFGAIAILFNPLAPVYLSRQIWRPIDLICAAAIVCGAFVLGGAFDRLFKP